MRSKIVAKTPYCATCHKAGEPISVYTGHFTKSSPGPDGVVVCPLILSSVCGYCRKSGHWTKFCPVLLSRQQNEAEVDDSCSDCNSSVSSSVSISSSKSDMLKKAIHVGVFSTPSPCGASSTENVSLDKYNYTKKMVPAPSAENFANATISGSATSLTTCGNTSRPLNVGAGIHKDVSLPVPIETTFTPVTPDTSPPTSARRRLWADDDSDEE
jgi:hypothetical protein